MPQKLTPEILDILSRADTTKVLSTVDESGIPYAAPSPFLHARSDDLLVHLELLETSATGRNLIFGLWHDRIVTASIAGADGTVFVVKAAPAKVLISGPVFSLHYQRVRSVLGDADLAGVWLLRPLEVINETYATRRSDEEAHHPFSIHLDRLLLSTDGPTKEGAQS